VRASARRQLRLEPDPRADRLHRLARGLTDRRLQFDEAALFTVKDGKVVREELFYVTG